MHIRPWGTLGVVKAGVGLSTLPESRGAAMEAGLAARAMLSDGVPTLALLFASLHHASAAEEVLDAVHAATAPTALIGCVAEGVVAGDREVESGPAVSVWLGAFPGRAETFHMEFVRTSSGGALTGWRFEDGASPGGVRPDIHLMICDPHSFPADLLLQHLNESVPGALVAGGMASGARAPGEAILFQDRTVHTDGAVGAAVAGTAGVRTLISQGCRPIGPSLVITRCEGNLVQELGGKPPLDQLREIVARLAPADQELASRGLHAGRVIDEYKPEHGQGDFLIRGILGVDPEAGAIAVGDRIEVGQTLRFHVRDSVTADEDLRCLLDLEAGAHSGPPGGALLFTCNGRGSRLFSEPDHDAKVVTSKLRGAPLAGFFCAGELGPVSGKNFVHGFTASLVVFPR